MKHLTIILFFLIPGQIVAQSFSPEINLKTGIQRISGHSFNPDYEQDHTVMYEIEAFHPFFNFEKSELSVGLTGSLRREAERLDTYACLDCPQYNFKGHAIGSAIKLQTVDTPVVLGVYSGLYLNQTVIEQTHSGMLPANIQAEPLITIKETYLNLSTGFRANIPVYKNFFFTGDFRLYFPMDDSDFNQRRTALSVGLKLRF
ncbi:hypothetical protein [Gracilimonas sp. BCB1]|uniref:hypothetical protein n=1 Tax=Gracilimonas sp. BCB1 TaxID=3152362 RepID=UPI0032D90992